MNQIKLDDQSLLHDSVAEDKFRSLLSHFIDWLKDDDESDSSESSTSSDEENQSDGDSDENDEITSADLELEIPLD